MAGGSKNAIEVRRDLFAAEYLKTRDATRSAIAAGYAPKSAAVRGNLLLKHPDVRQKIAAGTEKIKRRSGVDAQWVIDQLMQVAGQEDVAQSTKVRALELLAKHLGMLEDKISVKTDGLTAEQRTERVVMLLERARSRVGGE